MDRCVTQVAGSPTHGALAGFILLPVVIPDTTRLLNSPFDHRLEDPSRTLFPARKGVEVVSGGQDSRGTSPWMCLTFDTSRFGSSMRMTTGRPIPATLVRRTSRSVRRRTDRLTSLSRCMRGDARRPQDCIDRHGQGALRPRPRGQRGASTARRKLGGICLGTASKSPGPEGP